MLQRGTVSWKRSRVIDLDVFICQALLCLRFTWEQSQPHEGKLNKDREAVKQATALSDVAVYAPHHAHTSNTHTHIHLLWHRPTHTPSAADSRALSPITAEHGSAAWWEQTIWGICQVLADSKQSTVKNALPWPGQPAPWLRCALHAAGDTILRVQDETHHHPFTSLCSLPLQTAAESACAAPIWAAAADLPARLERGLRHPGDSVHSHYPLWEKLCGGPGTRERERERVGGKERRRWGGTKQKGSWTKED